MKRTISLLLAIIMVLLSLTGCIRVKSRKAAETAAPTEKSTVAPAVTPEPLPTEGPTAEPTAEPTETPEPTAEPTPSPEPLPPQNWADIDMDFFREYLKTDITSLHQLVKDRRV